jgi:transcription elongation factor GreB
MSRAFVKDDGGDGRVLVPERAPLPDGTPNRVTRSGLRALRTEHAALTRERDALAADPDAADRSRRLTIVRASLEALEERLASARVVAPGPDDGVVRFGATVDLAGEDGTTLRVRIVGVDEADALEGRIAFTAPLASALLDRRRGEEVEVVRGAERRRWRVVAVEPDVADDPTDARGDPPDRADG